MQGNVQIFFSPRELPIWTFSTSKYAAVQTLVAASNRPCLIACMNSR